MSQDHTNDDHEYPHPPAQWHSPESIEAAQSMAGQPAARQRTIVEEAIRDHGPISDEQICDITGLEGNSVRPRRGELEKAGRIRKAALRVTNRSGRRAGTWEIADTGAVPAQLPLDLQDEAAA